MLCRHGMNKLAAIVRRPNKSSSREKVKGGVYIIMEHDHRFGVEAAF